jgi:cytochrome b
MEVGMASTMPGSGDEEAPEAGAARPVLLWDLPIRLVHWSFVLLLPALWWTWRSGHLEWHDRLGYLLTALLVFRLFWGVAGSPTARFARFVKGPVSILRYLTGRSPKPVVGHNPIGGWSVILLLGLMIAQVVTGFFTQDIDGIESGPLTPLVSYDTAEAARGWHGLLFDLLVAAVILHVAAILFYLVFRRDNLVAPMITGRKAFDDGVEVPAVAPLWRALLGLGLGAGIAWWVSLGCPI